MVRGIRAISGIEIKLNNAPTWSKGYYQRIEDLKTLKNFILVPEVEAYRTTEDVWVCNLTDFLKKHLKNLFIEPSKSKV